MGPKKGFAFFSEASDSLYFWFFPEKKAKQMQQPMQKQWAQKRDSHFFRKPLNPFIFAFSPRKKQKNAATNAKTMGPKKGFAFFSEASDSLYFWFFPEKKAKQMQQPMQKQWAQKRDSHFFGSL